MAIKTKISWCDSTLNLVIGCSNQCAYCYASRSSSARVFKVKFGPNCNYHVCGPRFEKTLASWNRKPWVCNECGGSNLIMEMRSRNKLAICRDCNKAVTAHSRRVFLNSLSDWLDPKWQVRWMDRLLEAIRANENLTFILLTKFPEEWASAMTRVFDYTGSSGLAHWINDWYYFGKPPKNLWLLTTVTNQADLERRAPELLKIPAAVHGLSIEPIKGYIGLSEYLPKLDWLITGGETNTRGRKADSTDLDWIRTILWQCKKAGKPCFVKQMGSKPVDMFLPRPEMEKLVPSNLHYKHPKGANPVEWPRDLRVQQFPL